MSRGDLGLWVLSTKAKFQRLGSPHLCEEQSSLTSVVSGQGLGNQGEGSGQH